MTQLILTCECHLKPSTLENPHHIEVFTLIENNIIICQILIDTIRKRIALLILFGKPNHMLQIGIIVFRHGKLFIHPLHQPDLLQVCNICLGRSKGRFV